MLKTIEIQGIFYVRGSPSEESEDSEKASKQLSNKRGMHGGILSGAARGLNEAAKVVDKP